MVKDFTLYSCRDFVKVLSSKEPVPGGGGAAAVAGAIGMALGNMVGSLTVGKKKYENVQNDILTLKEQADELQQELLDLTAEDARAFEPLSKAYGLPQNTEEEKAHKEAIMEEALKKAALPPIKIMQACCKAIALHQSFADKGTRMAISDVGCGVILCKSALQAASLNVLINTKSMKDRTHAEALNKQVRELSDEYTAMADAIYAQVLSKLV